MYNIIDQHQNHSLSGNESVMMVLANETKSSPVLTTTTGGFKIDCAKECPCNVPVIPVPDQWLEVMVTGGFKVWHIIFIIIAFIVTIVVVYCCFHRCRIPRTKQEIEADLMRTNLTTKFRDYLQEFPNEPTTFLEALKRVQELEEKWANEQDDTGAKKRMGWLKLRGKDRQADKVTGPDAGAEPPAKDKAADGPGALPSATNKEKLDGLVSQELKTAANEDDKKKDAESAPPAQAPTENKAKSKAAETSNNKETTSKKHPANLRSAKMANVSDKAVTAANERQSSKVELAPEVATKLHKTKGEKVTKQKVDIEAGVVVIDNDKEVAANVASTSSPASVKPIKARRKRDKPNLSRTKAAHVGSRSESIEINSNILTIPVASHRRRHHQHADGKQHAETTGPSSGDTPSKREARAHSSRTRTAKKDSTVIQINTDLTTS